MQLHYLCKKILLFQSPVSWPQSTSQHSHSCSLIPLSRGTRRKLKEGEMSCGSDQLSQLRSLPTSCLPHPTLCGGSKQKNKMPMVCKNCSGTDKRPECCQRYSSHMYKTHHHTGCYEENQIHHSSQSQYMEQ